MHSVPPFLTYPRMSDHPARSGVAAGAFRSSGGPAHLRTPPARRSAQGSLRLFVVRGRRLIADALVEALNAEPQLRVVGTATTTGGAVGHPQLKNADVVLVDASHDRERALGAVSRLRDVEPSCKMLVFGVADSVEEALAFAEAGAIACLSREVTFQELVDTAVELQAGRICCPPPVACRLIERIGRLERAHGESRRAAPPALSARQRQILSLLSEGLTNKEMAQRLGLAVSTVKNHVHDLLKRLGARHRREAVRIAYLAGLVEQYPPRRRTAHPARRP